MSNVAVQVVRRPRALDFLLQAALVIGGSLFVAFCARIYLPLPGTPVPLTVQNLGVLLVGLALSGGFVQLLGPTGGYLIAYPFVAALTGYIFERGTPTFARAAWAAVAGEILLFTGGIAQLYILTHSFSKAISFGLYWFVFAEIMKVMFAAGAARSWQSLFSKSNSALL